MEYIIPIILIVIILILLVWYIVTSNKLNRLQVKIQEADSGIDVALEKRYAVLTKMVDTVRAYAEHEKETLFNVIKLREKMSIDEKSEVNKRMDDEFRKLNVIAENYPELLSSENYKTLQESIVDVEEHLQAARRAYNSNVSIFNQEIVTFPTKIVSSMKGLKKMPFFVADDKRKEDVKIDL